MRTVSWFLCVIFLIGCGGGEESESNSADSSDAPESTQSEPAETTESSLSNTEDEVVESSVSTALDDPPWAEIGNTTVSTSHETTTDTAPSEQSDLVAQAERLADQGHFQVALEKLSEAIGLDPEDGNAYFLRARLYAAAGQRANAAADYAAAVRLAPKHAEIRNYLGFFLMSGGQAEAALAEFTEAIRLKPEFREPYNNRGMLYVTRGEFDKALADFDQALKIDPKYVDALNNRGFAHMKAGRRTEALADFDAVLKIDPDYVNAHTNRGIAQFEEERYSEAAAAFTRAIALEPDNPKHYMNRREAFLKLNQIARAQEDERHGEWLATMRQLTYRIARNSDDPQRFFDRGMHQLSIGRYDGALADFSRALEFDEEFAEAYLERARVWFGQGDLNQALSDCNAALRHDAGQEAQSLRGDIHMELGRYKDAIADYTEARRIDSAVAEAYRRLAEELRNSGDTAAADEALRQASALGEMLDTTRQ